MAEPTNSLQGNEEPWHAKASRGTAAGLTDDARASKKRNQKRLGSPKPREDKIENKLVANVCKNQTLSRTPAMADLTHNLPGNQVPLQAEVIRASEEHRTDYTHRAKNGNKQGLASPKLCGNKIANKAMTNFGKNSALSTTPAMVGLTHNLPGNQVPLLAKETRASEEHRALYARGSKNGNNQGLLLPKPRGNIIANKVTTNKKVDDRMKNRNQLNAVLARLEQKRARGKPLPKRGDVKKAIVEESVKKVIDTGKAFCCVSGPFDVDTFVRDLPFPTRSEPTATLWAKVKSASLRFCIVCALLIVQNLIFLLQLVCFRWRCEAVEAQSKESKIVITLWAFVFSSLLRGSSTYLKHDFSSFPCARVSSCGICRSCSSCVGNRCPHVVVDLVVVLNLGSPISFPRHALRSIDYLLNLIAASFWSGVVTVRHLLSI